MRYQISTIGLSALAVLSLAACTPSSPEDTGGSSSSSSSTTNGRPLGKEGEFCGGIAAFQCEAGLTCIYDGTYPDAGGTCTK